ncbi:MAG: general secretion pathway protein GspB [Desulfobulbaceae bacterium]|nr:general secretion pathway protein GspB [Desulfobulbaceae bacterium]
MSYILEALKKSDQKRQKGQVPDLSTVQIEIPPEDKKKALWPYILMGILFLNGVVLAVIMRPDQSTVDPQAVVQNSGKQKPATAQEQQTDIEPQPTHQLSSVTQESSPTTVVPTVDENMAASQEERSPGPTREASAEASVVHERNIEEVDSEFARGMNIDTNQEETQVIPVQRSVTDGTVEEVDIEFTKGMNIDTNQNEQQVEPIQELVADSTIEEVVKYIGPELESIIVPKEDSVIVAEPEPIETTTLPDEQLEVAEINSLQQHQHAVPEIFALNEEKTRAQREPLHIMQLPLSIQEQLPEFHISAHVYYAKKPASRLASINGKIVREGHSLVPKLKVVEITSDGVIFSYHEYLFHVPIL